MHKTTCIKIVIISFFIIQQPNVMAGTFQRGEGGTDAIDDQVVVLENSTPNIIDVLINDILEKGDVVTNITQPSNGLVVLEPFGITYQSNANYCNNGIVTDNFTYTLTGGSTATVFVSVTCLAGSPIAQVIPVNQLSWLLFLLITIILMVKFKITSHHK